MEIARVTSGNAAPDLSAIVWAAKAHWGYPDHWMEEWREDLTVTPDFIAANHTFAARVDQQIVAFYALHLTPEDLRLEHFWVLPPWMGQGIGRRLFHHATKLAAEHRVTSLTIHSDPNAEPFYLHLGAVRIGTSTSEVDGCQRELPILQFALSPGQARP